MSVYSVYRWDQGNFDYYESAGTQGLDSEPRTLPRLSAPIGVAPEKALMALPSGARKVGSGALPVGELARGRGTGLGDLDFAGIDLASPWTWAAVTVIAVAVWTWWKSR